MSEATTVAEAIDAIKADPQWVLLDIMLPDGSGLDVLRRIKDDRAAIKVCVISGCHQHVLDQAMALGARCAFAKPLDMHQVMSALAN